MPECGCKETTVTVNCARGCGRNIDHKAIQHVSPCTNPNRMCFKSICPTCLEQMAAQRAQEEADA